MNAIFYNLIGNDTEVYFDDVMIRYKDFKNHLLELEQTMLHVLKMNSSKGASGVST